MTTFASWAMAASLVLAASGARAQQPSPGEIQAARQEFVNGAQAARRGDWAAAVESFTRSYGLYPRPLTLFNLAGAQSETGKLTAAAESYRRFLQTASGRDEVEQRPNAERALADVERRTAHVRVQADGLEEGDTLQIDGAPAARAVVGTDLPVDPGSHRVTVVRAGAEIAGQTFSLAEGASTEARLDAHARTAPTPHDTAAADQESHVAPATGATSTSGGPGVVGEWWFWTIVGAVVVGAVVAIVLVTQASPSFYQGNVSPGVLEVP